MDAYFDIFSGISGNMVLGALIDLGLDLDLLKGELDKLGLSDEYSIEVKRVLKEKIGGTYLEVELLNKNNIITIIMTIITTTIITAGI